MSEPKPYTATDYISLLQNLLPRGVAWSRSPKAVLTKLLSACAEELARVDRAAHLLPEEVTPSTTINGLNDWERVLALPDVCLPAGSTMQERRDAVLGKLRDLGRQDLGYWYELVETLGYEITIEEHWPALCG